MFVIVLFPLARRRGKSHFSCLDPSGWLQKQTVLRREGCLRSFSARGLCAKGGEIHWYTCCNLARRAPRLLQGAILVKNDLIYYPKEGKMF